MHLIFFRCHYRKSPSPNTVYAVHSLHFALPYFAPLHSAKHRIYWNVHLKYRFAPFQMNGTAKLVKKKSNGAKRPLQITMAIREKCVLSLRPSGLLFPKFRSSTFQKKKRFFFLKFRRTKLRIAVTLCDIFKNSFFKDFIKDGGNKRKKSYGLFDWNKYILKWFFSFLNKFYEKYCNFNR